MQLSSGTELEITLAGFSEAKELYQAILKAAKGVNVTADTEIDVSFLKDIMCELLSNKEVELALYGCMGRVKYGGNRIANVDETFESEVARGDYLEVCKEVALKNVLPFTKNLSALYQDIATEMGLPIQK